MKYQLILQIHFTIGMAALVSFWVAALSKKGGIIHRKAGQMYVLSMACILVSVIPMINNAINEGRSSSALGLAYLFVLAFTAIWVAWRSIKDKRDFYSYNSIFFKGLAIFLTTFALLILALSIKGASLLYAVFALTGIVFGGSMGKIALQSTPGPRWSLSQHLNGVALIFAATHGSFFRFGLAKLLPIPDSPELNTFAQISIIVLALILRLWLGRNYLGRKKKKIIHHFNGVQQAPINL